MERRKRSIAERLYSKVDKSGKGGCWIWRNSATRNGYGCIKVNGKPEGAHRVSWEIANGRTIPDGMVILHTCDNSLCINPSHLLLGTYSDNTQDAMRKGRFVPFRPTRSDPLTDEEIAEIRNEYDRGVSQRTLCRKYTVPPTSLKRIIGVQ